jgi:hypothetical protein
VDRWIGSLERSKKKKKKKKKRFTTRQEEEELGTYLVAGGMEEAMEMEGRDGELAGLGWAGYLQSVHKNPNVHTKEGSSPSTAISQAPPPTPLLVYQP